MTANNVYKLELSLIHVSMSDPMKNFCPFVCTPLIFLFLGSCKESCQALRGTLSWFLFYLLNQNAKERISFVTPFLDLTYISNLKLKTEHGRETLYGKLLGCLLFNNSLA